MYTRRIFTPRIHQRRVVRILELRDNRDDPGGRPERDSSPRHPRVPGGESGKGLGEKSAGESAEESTGESTEETCSARRRCPETEIERKGNGRETKGGGKIAERGQRGLSGDKEITRGAVSVVFALTVNPFSSQTEYTSPGRVGCDLERGTERLAQRVGAYNDIHSR